MFVSHPLLSRYLKFQNSHLPHAVAVVLILGSGSCHSSFQLFAQWAWASKFACSDQILALVGVPFLPFLCSSCQLCSSELEKWLKWTKFWHLGSRIQIYFSCLSANNRKPKERTEEQTAFGITLSLQIPTLCTNLLYSSENGFQET